MPVGIAVGGWLLQASAAHDALNAKYVELAIGILREPPKSDVDLRHWAVLTLTHNSPERFTDEEQTLLIKGKAHLPEDIFREAGAASVLGFNQKGQAVIYQLPATPSGDPPISTHR